jgi:hypothetical protein
VLSEDLLTQMQSFVWVAKEEESLVLDLLLLLKGIPHIRRNKEHS